MAQRSDSPLIKHLTQTYGPETARDWQRPPLVLLPEGFVDYLAKHFDDLPAALPSITKIHLPWDDVIFDSRDGSKSFTQLYERWFRDSGAMDGISTQDQESLRRGIEGLASPVYWARVRTLERFVARRSTSSPWGDWHGRALSDADGDGTVRRQLEETGPNALVLEVWLERRTAHTMLGLGPHPLEILLRRDKPWSGRFLLLCRDARCSCHTWTDDEVARMVMGRCARMTLLTLAYLTQCNEHMVEVLPTPHKPVPANQQKVQEAKPWLKESLPHFILLDPEKVGEYGHPSGRGAPTGMQHAPPRPHTRRGHWAVLRHERFARREDGAPRRVWVKQSWVGATEWTHLDQRYRVVMPQEKTN